MKDTYLSPAFSHHSPEETKFLKTVELNTALSLFWIDIIKPILREVKARYLLEIGAYKGDHTKWLARYCEENDGNLIVIEPIVTQEFRDVAKRFSRIRLIGAKSHDALPGIGEPLDAVILEGDLNYYSVLDDLTEIEKLANRTKSPFPLVFFSSSSWPYARRDMYYDPDGIPSEARHEYSRSGITPWSRLLQEGLINYPFANAKMEGGAKNGVYTAVEEFADARSKTLRCFSLPINHGLGIIYTVGSKVEDFIRTQLQPPPALARFLETIEIAWINTVLRALERRKAGQSNTQSRKGIWGLLSRLGF